MGVGSAATILGGTTLHAFAGIGLGEEHKETLAQQVNADARKRKRWQNAFALIIDEVSMIDAKLFEKLDWVAKKCRNNLRPFGGECPLPTCQCAAARMMTCW